MTVIPSQVSYTNKDHTSLTARAIELAESVLPGLNWRNKAEFQGYSLEAFSFVGDVILYYADRIARESRIGTASERKNIIALARLLAYELATATPATVDLTVTLPASPLADFTIPAGEVARTLDVVTPQRFQTLAAVTILQGADPPTAVVSAENSTTHVEQVAVNGLPDTEIFLKRTPFIATDLVVQDSVGVFTKKDTLLDSTATDADYVVLVDQKDQARLRFGDGVSNGRTPTGTVTVTYKTGGGTAGNVIAGSVVKFETPSYQDAQGNVLRPTVTHLADAAGGAGRESVAEARRNAPASLRTLNRSITRDDFQVHAEEVPGIDRALVLTSDEDLTIAENTGIIFPIPDGGGVPSQALKDAVTTQLTITKPAPLTFKVLVQDPVYLTVDIEARVTFFTDANKTQGREDIKTALAALFALRNADDTINTKVAFGADLRDGVFSWSDVFNAVRDVTLVERVAPSDGVKLNLLVADVVVGSREFPQLGTVTVRDATTGLVV